MSLEGSVHTPVGDMKKKQLVIVGGGLALLVGVYVYRKRQAASAAAASSSTDTGSGAAPSAATDPATGYPYGSPEDTAALQASSMAAYGAYAGGGGGGGSTLSTPPSGTTGFATNAAWAQAAEQYLAQSAGGDPTKISAALGKYLTGQQVTDEQAQIIQSAIAFEGYPPVSGTDSYPPSIRQAPVPSPPPGGGSTGGDVTPKAPTRLQTVGPATRTSIGIGWDPSAGADHYELHMDGRAVGITHDTWATPGALKPGSRHTFQVFALSPHGKKSPGSNSLTASTHK